MIETIITLTFIVMVVLVATAPKAGKKSELSDMEKARGKLKDDAVDHEP